PRFSVIVIQTEGVTLRLLQEVNDIPVLMSTLRQPLLLGVAGKRRLPTARRARCFGQRCCACLSSFWGSKNQRRLAAACCQAAYGYSAVPCRPSLRMLGE